MHGPVPASAGDLYQRTTAQAVIRASWSSTPAGLRARQLPRVGGRRAGIERRCALDREVCAVCGSPAPEVAREPGPHGSAIGRPRLRYLCLSVERRGGWLSACSVRPDLSPTSGRICLLVQPAHAPVRGADGGLRVSRAQGRAGSAFQQCCGECKRPGMARRMEGWWLLDARPASSGKTQLVGA